MNPSDLLHNPQLQNISPEKLQLFMELAQSTSPGTSSPKDMASSLKNASDTVQKKGIDFSSTERELIIETLKQNMPVQEQRKVDLLMQMMKSRR
ncbi:MAG: hypothetical protein RSD28_04840 [Lachnospiraceae bacterium]